MRDFILDPQRQQRIGQVEAIFCADKNIDQISAILSSVTEKKHATLFTRLNQYTFDSLDPILKQLMDYHPLSQTAFAHGTAVQPVLTPLKIAIVTAGTSDLAVAWEAKRTLEFSGLDSQIIADIGVAGLWRLQEHLPKLYEFDIYIVCAGMDAALISVLGGLLGGPIIALPVSTGYGTAYQGQTALHAILTSCASGIVSVNIDNGFGAACAAIRILSFCNKSNNP